VPLRISVGAGIFPRDGRTLDSILIAADRRMYEDKTAARRLADRRATAASEPSSAVLAPEIAPAPVAADPALAAVPSTPADL
jgi:hypothetical protein